MSGNSNLDLQEFYPKELEIIAIEERTNEI